MHLGLDAASAVVSAPFSPDGAAEVFLSAQRFIPSYGPRGGWLRLGILARRYNGVGIPVCDGVMALARVVGSVCSDRTALHNSGGLAEQFRKLGGSGSDAGDRFPDEWRIADIAPGDLDGSDLQRLFIDADVDLAP